MVQDSSLSSETFLVKQKLTRNLPQSDLKEMTHVWCLYRERWTTLELSQGWQVSLEEETSTLENLEFAEKQPFYCVAIPGETQWAHDDTQCMNPILSVSLFFYSYLFVLQKLNVYFNYEFLFKVLL